MSLRNFLLLALYVSDKPSRLPNLLKNRVISRISIIKNDSLKLAYIINPKVASSSISFFLNDGIETKSLAGKSTKEKHAILHKETLLTYHEIDQLKAAGYFVFSFVRNPYRRIVSFYRNKFEQKHTDHLQSKGFAFNRQFQKIRNFSDTVKVIANTPDYLSDAHFMSQSRILFGPDGHNKLDFIGKLENLAQDFDIISRKANRDIIEKTNTTTSSDHEWMKLYTPELIQLMHERFESDFKIFGYEDEHQKLLEFTQRRT